MVGSIVSFRFLVALIATGTSTLKVVEMRVSVPTIEVCGTNEKLKGMGKLYVFFVSNGTIKVKILENDQTKPITHAADLKMFPDINVDNL